LILPNIHNFCIAEKWRALRRLITVVGSTLLVTALAWRSAAADAPPVRIGVITTLSGPFTQAGKAGNAAIAAFIHEHGATVAGRKIEIITRDDGGNAPDTAKRLAQELIVSDHVDFLMGLVFSPNAKAVGDVSTAAKIPTFITNAAAYGILEPNPYMARFSYTLGEETKPLAEWAVKNGIKSVYSLVLDYSAGLDAASSFQTAFTAGGGKVVGELHVPQNSPDFSAYIQRIKDAKPQAVFAFLSVSGGPFLKAWDAAGGPATGIKILATGDLTNETLLPADGDSALGVITAMNYSASHDSELNRKVTADMHAADPSVDVPDFASVAMYDALHAIYTVVESQPGNIDPNKTMQIVRGMKFESPRGPIEIDPQTREIVQNIYIRRVEKRDGKLINREFAVVPQVHDPVEK
jgi:branched-chain amino acid transport system substrate-binding protein